MRYIYIQMGATSIFYLEGGIVVSPDLKIDNNLP